jgi:hypothetical protein
VPSATPPPVPTQQSERADAQQALSAYQAASQVGESGGPSALSAARRPETISAVRRTLLRRESSTTTPCTNGVITTTNQTSPTTAVITVDSYYDPTCTTLWAQLTWNVTAGGTTAAGPFSYDDYAKTGAQEGYTSGTLSITFNSALTAATAFSVDMNDIATSPTSPSYGQVELACGQTSSLNCGFAVIADTAGGSEQGANMTMGAGITMHPAGSYSVTVNVNAQAYTSGANGMSISPGTFPAWTISGGTLENSVAGTLSVLYSGTSTPNSLSASFTDAQYDTKVTLAASNGGLTGTISRESASLAAFSVDVSGNGTITYGNGTTGQIRDWLVIG